MAAGAGLLQAVAALSPVTVKGNAFFNGTNRFYIRGIDYQPGKFTLLKAHLPSFGVRTLIGAVRRFV